MSLSLEPRTSFSARAAGGRSSECLHDQRIVGAETLCHQRQSTRQASISSASSMGAGE